MIIPHRELSAAALAGVVEEYVTREGTELSESTGKSRAVVRLLERGELVLVYDPDIESCNIVSREQVSAFRNEPREGE